MDLVQSVNTIASAVIFSGVTWAIYSRYVCDGILIKICLASLAIGAAANFNASLYGYVGAHAKLWILCSVAALVIAVLLRCMHAAANNKRPCFINYDGMAHR